MLVNTVNIGAKFSRKKYVHYKASLSKQPPFLSHLVEVAKHSD